MTTDIAACTHSDAYGLMFMDGHCLACNAPQPVHVVLFNVAGREDLRREFRCWGGEECIWCLSSVEIRAVITFVGAAS